MYPKTLPTIDPRQPETTTLGARVEMILAELQGISRYIDGMDNRLFGLPMNGAEVGEASHLSVADNLRMSFDLAAELRQRLGRITEAL